MRQLLLFVVCLGWLLYPFSAQASISSVSQLDGPSADIVDFGGSAMAPDGTGGVVYRKRLAGRIHIFAAQFDGKRWHNPQQVDAGQQFDSSWPVIGAGNGGRLVVAWVQEFGPSSDRLYSAGLDPGATRFQKPVPVDLNVGESTATYPSLAMNAAGQAWIAYLVVQAPSGAEPPGYTEGELRAAKYDGAYWTSVGFPLNRNPATPILIPAAGATPKVAIESTGNGLLAWLEPDDNLIPRVWARRLFSGQPGIALQVSPAAFNNQPLGPADAFSLDDAGFGQGAVAFRVNPTPGSAITGPRIMLATIPETSSTLANAFGAPRLVDGGTGGIAPGPPSVAVDRVGDAQTAFGFNQRSVMVGSDDKTIDPPVRLDDGRTAVPGLPQVDNGVSGAVVAAWKIKFGNASGIGVTERRFDGVSSSRTLSSSTPGVVNNFDLAGSGLGDAIVGWDQGPDSGRTIAAVVVDAPPDPFAVQTPNDWVRTPPTLDWDTPAHAIGGVTYAVTVDDETVKENMSATELKLRAKDVDDGISEIQVVAADSDGQETTSFPAELKLDRQPPKAKVKRYGNRLVRVTLSDGSGRSGVDASSVKVSWGDGKRSSGHKALQHRYGGAGPYKMTISAADKAGNKLKRTLRVSA